MKPLPTVEEVNQIKSDVFQNEDVTLPELSKLWRQCADEIKTVNAVVKALEEFKADIEERILLFMQTTGQNKLENPEITVVRSEEEYPSVKDWSALVGFMKEHEAFHLFQKRLSKTAFNEVCGMIDGVPPGIEIFKKEKINVKPTKRK